MQRNVADDRFRSSLQSVNGEPRGCIRAAYPWVPAACHSAMATTANSSMMTLSVKLSCTTDVAKRSPTSANNTIIFTGWRKGKPEAERHPTHIGSRVDHAAAKIAPVRQDRAEPLNESRRFFEHFPSLFQHSASGSPQRTPLPPAKRHFANNRQPSA